MWSDLIERENTRSLSQSCRSLVIGRKNSYTQGVFLWKGGQPGAMKNSIIGVMENSIGADV
jgi:hypothetical protein